MAKNTEQRRVEIITNASQSTASINQLRAASRLLYNDMMKLPKGSEEFRKAMDKWRSVDERFKQAQAEVRGLDQNMQKLNKTQGSWWGEVKKIAAGAAMGNMFAALGAEISNLLNSMISGRKKMADEMADIAKTTNMSTEEVRELNKELSSIDTRSSTSDLRKLAMEAGKLGKTGKDDVRKFVEEMDKINVALGQDLGEDAIIQIGKMTNVYETGAMNIASAVNSVGQASEASEGYLVDFAARLGGAARTAKISAPDIIGYGAVLDQMGLQVEMSGTALSNFTLDFIKDTAKFEAAAGMRAGSLQKIIGEKGTNAGMLAFIEAMKQSSRSEAEFLQRMEQVGIDGSRGAAVFLTLANNIELVKQQQDLANVEFQKGTSVIDEFNKKNNNFAANLDKIGKALYGWLTNNFITDIFEELVNAMADTESEADKLVNKFTDQAGAVNKLQREISPLLDRYDFLKTKTNLNKTEQEELKKIITAVGETIPSAITQFGKYGEAMDINSDKARDFIRNQALALKSMNRDAIVALKDQMKERDAVLKEYQKQLDYTKNDPRSQSGYQFLDPAELSRRMDANFTATYRNLKPKMDEIRRLQEEDAARLRQLQGEDLMDALNSRSTKKANPGGGAGGGGATGAPAAGPVVQNAKAEAKAVVNVWEETVKKEFEITKDALLAWKQGQEMVINEAYIQGTISKEKHTAELERLDMLYLEAVRQAYVDYGKDTKDVEIDIQQTKIKNLEKIAKFIEDHPEVVGDAPKTNKDGGTGTSSQKAAGKSGKDGKRAASAWDFTDAAQQGLQATLDMIATRENAELASDRKIYETKLANIERLREQGIISEQKYQSEKLKLDDEYNKKTAEVRRKQWERQKIAAISQAVINTAMGVTSALAVAPPAGFILAGLVGAAGALQIAKIASEPVPEFAMGGSTVDVTGESGRRYRAQRGRAGGYYDKPTYIVGEKGGELVVPNWLYRAPAAMNLMGALEASIAQRSTAPLNGGGDAMTAATLAKLNAILERGVEVNWDQVGYTRFQNNWQAAQDIAKL